MFSANDTSSSGSSTSAGVPLGRSMRPVCCQQLMIVDRVTSVHANETNLIASRRDNRGIVIIVDAKTHTHTHTHKPSNIGKKETLKLNVCCREKSLNVSGGCLRGKITCIQHYLMTETRGGWR